MGWVSTAFTIRINSSLRGKRAIKSEVLLRNCLS